MSELEAIPTLTRIIDNLVSIPLDSLPAEAEDNVSRALGAAFLLRERLTETAGE